MHHLPQRHFYSGDKIAIEGKKSAGLYFIEEGRVEIYTYHGTKRIHIAYVEAGDVVGEMGLIDADLPSANIVALEETRCRFMEKRLLEEKILKTDPFIRALLRLFSRRIKRAISQGDQHRAHFR